MIILILTDQVHLAYQFHRPLEDKDGPLISEENLKPVVPKPLSFYLESIAGSHLFGRMGRLRQDAPAKESLEDLLKDFRLRGIAVVAFPEAILEDAKTRRIHFLKEGDSLGGLKLEKILQEKIVLSNGTEKKELRIEARS